MPHLQMSSEYLLISLHRPLDPEQLSVHQLDKLQDPIQFHHGILTTVSGIEGLSSKHSLSSCLSLSIQVSMF